jgi:hypothetical protein
MKILDIISESSSAGMTAEFGAPPKGTTLAPVEKWYQRNLRENAEMVAKIKGGWSWPLFNALRVLGWLAPCAWLTASYWALDDIAKLSPEEFTQYTGVSADKKNSWVADSRSMLLGTFAAQYLAPLAYYTVKNIARMTGILEIIAVGLGTVLTRGKAGKLIIGATVIEQAALIAFVNWLGSEAGRQWMTQNVLVGGIIKLSGAGIGTIWDLLYRKFFEYTGIQQPEKSAVDKAVDNVSNLPPSNMTSADIAAWRDENSRQGRVTTGLTPTLPIDGRSF